MSPRRSEADAQNEDRMRAMFRKADASLGYAPPDLDQTIRKAKRDELRQRVFAGAAIVVLLAGAGIMAVISLRPETRTITPIASGSPTAPEATPLAPCGDFAAIGDFVREFMARRSTGAGAEPCMTAGAAEQYRTQNADPYDPNANGGGGPLCLYACGAFRVIDYNLENARKADANSYEAEIVVLLSDGNETVRQYEGLAIGTGVPSTSDESQAFVVRGAWTTPGLP